MKSNSLLGLGYEVLQQVPSITRGANKVVKKVTLGRGANFDVSRLAPNAENPLLDIGCVARDNYSLIGMRVRDGQKILDQCVFSMSADGKVLKYRMALGENACNLSTRGFVDRGQQFDSKNWGANIQRRGGTVLVDADSGKKFANHSTINEAYVKEYLQNMKQLGVDYYRSIKKALSKT